MYWPAGNSTKTPKGREQKKEIVFFLGFFFNPNAPKLVQHFRLKNLNFSEGNQWPGWFLFRLSFLENKPESLPLNRGVNCHFLPIYQQLFYISVLKKELISVYTQQEKSNLPLK